MELGKQGKSQQGAFRESDEVHGLRVVGEWLKDLVRIYDDADDFIKQIKPRVEGLKSLFAKFGAMSADARRTVEQMHSRQDNGGEVIKLMDSLDIERPMLIGKSLISELNKVRGDLDKLEGKLRRLPAKVKDEVRPALQNAYRVLENGIKQHARTIAVFSQMQEQRKRFYRSLGGTAAVGLAGLGAGAVLSAGALSMVRAMMDAPRGIFTHDAMETGRFLDGAMDTLGRLLWQAKLGAQQ